MRKQEGRKGRKVEGGSGMEKRCVCVSHAGLAQFSRHAAAPEVVRPHSRARPPAITVRRRMPRLGAVLARREVCARKEEQCAKAGMPAAQEHPQAAPGCVRHAGAGRKSHEAPAS